MLKHLLNLCILLTAFHSSWHRSVVTYAFVKNGLMSHFPARSFTSLSGKDFLSKISQNSFAERERAIMNEIHRGNVPDHLRKLVPLTFTHTSKTGEEIKVTLWVMPDYLSVGSNQDYVRVPLTPITAQQVADELNFVLPTKKIVDLVYRHGDTHLKPQPIRPDDAMNSPERIIEHNKQINRQLHRKHADVSTLLVGHKKDVVVSNRLNQMPGRVAIYGWHKITGQPTQPLSLVHDNDYADYSHGIRFVHNTMLIDGEEYLVKDVLKDPDLCHIISDEGVVRNNSYF